MKPRTSFSDFGSPTTSDEGPVRTTNIERQRFKPQRAEKDKEKRHQRRTKKRRTGRAS